MPARARTRLPARRPADGGERTAFCTPQINLYTEDVERSLSLYLALGFVETFKTPPVGPLDHVEVRLDGFTIGVAAVRAANAVHGLDPPLGGRSVEIVLWTDHTDRAFGRLAELATPVLSAPHDFLGCLRVAWVADLDGNPIQLVQRRKPLTERRRSG